MNNLNEYTTYENSLNVLNEGFFDFIKKWTKRIFHKMFKADSFEELYERLGKIENIIKFGKKNDGSDEKPDVSDKTVEVPKRENKKKPENKDNNKPNDSANTKNGENDILVLSDEAIDNINQSESKRSRSRKPINEDIKLYQRNDVNNSDINMNIPSFPQMAATLLKTLQSQIEERKKQLSVAKLDSTLNDIRNKNSKLDAHYASQLEIFVTDFFRKYAGGKLTLPTPAKGKQLSYDELQAWNKFATEKLPKAENGFEAVTSGMKKVVEEYKEMFKSEFDELLKREDSFINKYKDGEKSDEDIKFESEWKSKINSKMDQIVINCENYIQTAVLEYFVSSPIYKDALEYVRKALEVLLANSKNLSGDNNNNNILKEMYYDYDNDSKNFINNLNRYLEIFKKSYTDLFDDNFKDNLSYKFDEADVTDFFNKFSNRLNSNKKMDKNDYLHEIVLKMVAKEQCIAYIILKAFTNEDFNQNEMSRLGIIKQENNN